MYTKILVKYGELVLKKNNRKTFIRKLKENAEKILKTPVETKYDCMVVDYSKENIENLKYLFGISFYSPVYEIPTQTIEEIKDFFVKQQNDFESDDFTFKVVTKRNWKGFSLISDEINREVAKVIFNLFPKAKVNVKEPEVKINIEIRLNSIYIYFKTYKGLGGLPVGISGKAIHLISGGIDSPVAAFEMMKRGVELEFLSFITPPHTDDKTIEKVDNIIKVLLHYQPKIILHQYNYTKLMNYIGLVSNQAYKITLMRRSFYRIATALAQKKKIIALSNGENIGQVASQTLESMNVIGRASDLQIYRPLVTTDKIETINKAKKIGTLDISIEQANEACELFAPKKPIIQPSILEVEKLENELDMLLELENELIPEGNIKIFKNF